MFPLFVLSGVSIIAVIFYLALFGISSVSRNLISSWLYVAGLCALLQYMITYDAYQVLISCSIATIPGAFLLFAVGIVDNEY